MSKKTTKHRITGFRVWLGDTLLYEDRVGRSTFYADTELAAERDRIRQREIDRLARQIFVDFTLKSQTDGNND